MGGRHGVVFVWMMCRQRHVCGLRIWRRDWGDPVYDRVPKDEVHEASGQRSNLEASDEVMQLGWGIGRHEMS